MLRDTGTMIITDFLLLLLLSGFLFGKFPQTLACSTNLVWVGAGFCIYFTWFVIRNLIIMGACLCASKPDDWALAVRAGCVTIDWAAFTIYVIWATLVMFSQEVEDCRNTNEAVAEWWFACMVCVVFGWFYAGIVSFVCAIACPIFSCLFCVFCISGTAQSRARAE